MVLDAQPFKTPSTSTYGGQPPRTAFASAYKSPYFPNRWSIADPASSSLQTPPQSKNLSHSNPNISMQSITYPKKVTVTKSKYFLDNDSKIPTYKTRSKKRGKVLIINNIKFDNPKENRDGADEDDKVLKKLFEEMGFVVESYRNKSAKVSEA